MGALFCGYQRLLWKSKSHVFNLKHWILHHLQYSCYFGQMQQQPCKHFLLSLSSYILKSWAKESYHFRISFNLELYHEKPPPQIFLAFLVKNGSVKCNQTSHFHPRLHKPISKVLPMYRYLIVASIYFPAKILSQTISCFRHSFHRCQKIQICKYSCDSQRFQVFT